MIKFFRKIRQNSLTDSKFRVYLLYAIGEVVLVVIGILIALAINTKNGEIETRQKELKYLSGIKADLNLNAVELNSFMNTRKTSVNSANIILEIFNNEKELILDEFNFHNLNVQIWFPFRKNDNTYQELINSGNLSIISNDSIKTLLLNMQLGYKQIEFIENHMYTDFENYMFPIYFSSSDIQSDYANYRFQLSNGTGTEGKKGQLSKEKIELMLNNQTFKNAFFLSVFNNNRLIDEYEKMIDMTERLIYLIDLEHDKK